MARIRTIKPSFWLDDELAELDPLTRMLFIGLWNHADRRGRLKDRPTVIKASVLPYDECDCDAMLDDLNNAGFIIRYSDEGHEFIQVINFETHQVIGREAESIIPPPTCDVNGVMYEACTEHVQGNYGREGKGREGKEEKAGFEEFKEGYPRRAKGSNWHTARISWNRVTRDTEPEVILAGLKVHPFDDKDGGQFIPMPSTWLNQHRWTVEAAEPDPADDPLAGKWMS